MFLADRGGDSAICPLPSPLQCQACDVTVPPFDCFDVWPNDSGARDNVLASTALVLHTPSASPTTYISTPYPALQSFFVAPRQS